MVRPSLQKLHVSCQKHNLKPFLSDYIYRICYKNAKKGKPEKNDLPLLKNDITGSDPTLKTTDTLQIHEIEIRYMFVGDTKGFTTIKILVIFSDTCSLN